MNTKNRKSPKGKTNKNHDVAGIVCVIISSFFLICLITPLLSDIGVFVKRLTMGLVGYMSYPIVLCTLLLGILLLMNKRLVLTGKQLVFVLFMALSAVLILQTALDASRMGGTLGDYLGSLISFDPNNTTAGRSVGGVIFGLLAFGIKSILTFVGAYILYALLLALFAGLLIYDCYRAYNAAASRRKPREVEAPPFEKGKGAQPIHEYDDTSLFLGTIVPQTDSESGDFASIYDERQSGLNRYEQASPVTEQTQQNASTGQNEQSLRDDNQSDAFKKLYGDPDEMFKRYDVQLRNNMGIGEHASGRSNFLVDDTQPMGRSDYSTPTYSPKTIMSSPSVTEPQSTQFVSPTTQSPSAQFVSPTSQSPSAQFVSPTEEKQSLPDVPMPPDKDISGMIVDGPIINGDEISKQIQNDRRTRRPESDVSAMPSIQSQPSIIQSKPIEPQPPIINGYEPQQTKQSVQPKVEPQPTQTVPKQPPIIRADTFVRDDEPIMPRLEDNNDDEELPPIISDVRDFERLKKIREARKVDSAAKEIKREEPKREEVKQEPKREEIKREEPKFEQPKFEQSREEIKREEPKFEQPKFEQREAVKNDFTAGEKDDKEEKQGSIFEFESDDEELPLEDEDASKIFGIVNGDEFKSGDTLYPEDQADETAEKSVEADEEPVEVDEEPAEADEVESAEPNEPNETTEFEDFTEEPDETTDETNETNEPDNSVYKTQETENRPFSAAYGDVTEDDEFVQAVEADEVSRDEVEETEAVQADEAEEATVETNEAEQPEQPKRPEPKIPDSLKFVDEEVDMSERHEEVDNDNTGYYVREFDKKVSDYSLKLKDTLAAKAKAKNQIHMEDYSVETPAEPPKKVKKPHKYNAPPIDMLLHTENGDEEEIDFEANAKNLEEALRSLKVDATVTNITHGPAITRYELQIPPGQSVQRMPSYAKDIAYSLASSGKIRIEAPITGKRAVGVEVPNKNIAIVPLRDIIDSKEFGEAKSLLTLALGKDITGTVMTCNLEKMPHLLIAGTTGSGKSACLNCIIMSILYKAAPDDVRLILVDPKQVEFVLYRDMPHLLMKKIINDNVQANNAFKWACDEMERRYTMFAKYATRNIDDFNSGKAVKEGLESKLPRIVIIVDELADLMMARNSREIEDNIKRLAQKARAAGIHLILATQRPSVDVLTGTIKANFPSRIAFAVKSMPDSKTILDSVGAETLLGRGDMLYAPIDYTEPKRIQGAFVTTEEITSVVEYVREHNETDFDEAAEKAITFNPEEAVVTSDSEGSEESVEDPLMKDVLRKVIETGTASASQIQRRFAVGYNRASRIIDQMEENGYIGPLDGSKPREVYITRAMFAEIYGEEV